MLEEEILDLAIGALRNETGIAIEVLGREFGGGIDLHTDGMIRIQGANANLPVETKKWAPQMNVGAVINHMRTRYGDKGILVGDHINPNIGEKLREANIQYMDTAGNAYINQLPVYIYITGRKKKLEYHFYEKTGRAFTATGLKVTYLFLETPEIMNAPYREIAKQAKVALGNIGWIMRDLINAGYIQEARNGGTKKLIEYDRLLERWIEQYPITLKPKLKLEEFIAETPDWWEQINQTAINACWGGEIAAAIYTDYLNPRDGTVYIKKENLTELAIAGRLRKPQWLGERGGYRVQVFEKFWDENYGPTRQGLANPIIVYADLVETGDTRNLEAAERLREKYIDRHNG